MTFKSLRILWIVILFLLLFLTLFATSAWPAETKNCLIEISASLEAVVTFQGGEIWYIQIKSADGFPTYLYPEAGKIDETKVKNELGKNIVYAFRYNKKDCLGDKHDEILGIFAYTLTGPKDVSEQFFSKKSDKRTGLTK